MERTEVFETMKHLKIKTKDGKLVPFELNETQKYLITAEHMETFTRLFRKKAQSIGSEVRGWTRWEENGRIYLGWKRACCPPLVSAYTKYRYKPLSTIEIIKRKVRVWLDKK